MKASNSNRSVWHQIRVIALLPLTIFLWMTGWTLHWIGTQRMPLTTANKKTITSFEKEAYKRNKAKEHLQETLDID